LQCPGGKYQPSQSKQECQGKPCAAGRFGNVAAASASKVKCNRCSIGTYQPSLGKNSCIKCGSGQYQYGEGSSKCMGTPCPAGYFGAVGAVKNKGCTKCKAGRWNTRQGVSSCVLCLAGTYQLSTAADTTVCQGSLCQLGYWGKVGAASVAASTCRKCPVGYSQGRHGGTSCDSCSPGRFAEPAKAKCSPCPSGQFMPQKMKFEHCLGIPCRPGYVANEMLQSSAHKHSLVPIYRC
jgi:hypothetical protein